MKRFDENGVPIVLLNHLYYQYKKGLNAFIAKFNYKRLYKNETYLSEDMDKMFELGFVEKVEPGARQFSIALNWNTPFDVLKRYFLEMNHKDHPNSADAGAFFMALMAIDGKLEVSRIEEI